MSTTIEQPPGTGSALARLREAMEGLSDDDRQRAADGLLDLIDVPVDDVSRHRLDLLLGLAS